MGGRILQFKTVTLTDLPQIKSIVEQTAFQSCQLSTGGLYCLSRKYSTEVSFSDNFFFVKQRRKGFGVCYFMPVGVGDLSAAVEQLRRYHAA
ncbi:MAG: DUF2156 domain-containing protein, partial [Prevotellaceae bacterium]|nr:DUF2156 domain-containing protein [Prevotellaceae bacterium]